MWDRRERQVAVPCPDMEGGITLSSHMSLEAVRCRLMSDIRKNRPYFPSGNAPSPFGLLAPVKHCMSSIPFWKSCLDVMANISVDNFRTKFHRGRVLSADGSGSECVTLIS